MVLNNNSNWSSVESISQDSQQYLQNIHAACAHKMSWNQLYHQKLHRCTNWLHLCSTHPVFDRCTNWLHLCSTHPVFDSLCCMSSFLARTIICQDVDNTKEIYFTSVTCKTIQYYWLTNKLTHQTNLMPCLHETHLSW